MEKFWDMLFTHSPGIVYELFHEAGSGGATAGKAATTFEGWEEGGIGLPRAFPEGEFVS